MLTEDQLREIEETYLHDSSYSRTWIPQLLETVRHLQSTLDAVEASCDQWGQQFQACWKNCFELKAENDRLKKLVDPNRQKLSIAQLREQLDAMKAGEMEKLEVPKRGEVHDAE